MALIRIWDTETTSLETRSTFMIDLGAILYDTDDQKIVKVQSDLILWPERPLITPLIEKLTGITQKMLDRHGVSPQEAIERYFNLHPDVEYDLGFNSLLFDRYVLETAILRAKMPDSIKQKFYSMKHIDAMLDIIYPELIKTRKLTYLCFEHGIIMQDAHRALADALGLCSLIKKYSFCEMENMARHPLLTIEADVPYIDRQKASDAGFFWSDLQGALSKKKWLKNIRECNYQPSQYDFPTIIWKKQGGWNQKEALSDVSFLPRNLLSPKNLQGQQDLFSHSEDSNTQPLRDSYSLPASKAVNSGPF